MHCSFVFCNKKQALPHKEGKRLHKNKAQKLHDTVQRPFVSDLRVYYVYAHKKSPLSGKIPLLFIAY